MIRKAKGTAKGRATANDCGCDAHCQRIREEVHQMLDGRLTPARRTALRRHLAECRSCFSRIEFSRILKSLVRERVCSESCPGTLLHKIRTALWSPRSFKRA